MKIVKKKMSSRKSEYMKSYYAKNKLRILEYQKKYNEVNKNKIQKYQQDYSKQDYVKQKKTLYYEKNIRKEKESCPHCQKELSKSYLPFHIFKIHNL